MKTTKKKLLLIVFEPKIEFIAKFINISGTIVVTKALVKVGTQSRNKLVCVPKNKE